LSQRETLKQQNTNNKVYLNYTLEFAFMGKCSTVKA